jgi:medium-chain acyl-[acyl-carrier-protein] hydrolase
MEKTRLFCFPYAGGSATIYNKWLEYLDPSIELIPVELAGRGRRIRESLYRDIPDLIRDVFSYVFSRVGRSPYALFGHSLGGMICYELAQETRARKLAPPDHLFLSGWSAPDVKRPDEKIYHLMNDDEFKRQLLALGGTPPEVFEQADLGAFFLPLLRNDFKLAETRIPDEKSQPLDTNLTILLGKEDDQTAEQCIAWKNHTIQHCAIHYFDGGHFFILDQTRRIVDIINSTLKQTNHAGRLSFRHN